MAIISNTADGPIGTSSNWSTTSEYAIQGQMFEVSYILKDSHAYASEDLQKQHIKKQLALELANKMLDAGVIGFTQIVDPLSFSRKIIARCYLVPDDQVKILRTLYKDK
jgi:hypothetical protein